MHLASKRLTIAHNPHWLLAHSLARSLARKNHLFSGSRFQKPVETNTAVRRERTKEINKKKQPCARWHTGAISLSAHRFRVISSCRSAEACGSALRDTSRLGVHYQVRKSPSLCLFPVCERECVFVHRKVRCERRKIPTCWGGSWGFFFFSLQITVQRATQGLVHPTSLSAHFP